MEIGAGWVAALAFGGSIINLLVQRSLSRLDTRADRVEEHETRITLLEDWRRRAEIPEAWQG